MLKWLARLLCGKIPNPDPDEVPCSPNQLRSCSHGPNSKCPKWIEYSRRGFRVHGLERCCATRMTKAKMDFCIVHNNIGTASATPELRQQCKRNLEEYKRQYPEEYEEVFGKDDSIGYSCNID